MITAKKTLAAVMAVSLLFSTLIFTGCNKKGNEEKIPEDETWYSVKKVQVGEQFLLEKDIVFYSMCEHHLLPFHGKCHVVYIPKDGKILGLSKVARIVDTLSRKPQIQERLTSQIADTIEQAVDARAVCVVIEAEHLCMTMRGIRKPGSKTVTSAMRGGCRSDLRTRNEALALINRQRNG